MIAAAIWLNATKILSSFSYRTNSLRNRLNQLWHTSTTQRRAFLFGSRFLASTSVRRPTKWGNIALRLYVLQRTLASIPGIGTHVLAAPLGWSFALDQNGLQQLGWSSCVTSCSLALVTTSDNGTPRPSTSRCLLLPFFFPVRRVWPHGLLCHGRFEHGAINTLPSLRDALHLVIFGQSRLPDYFEHHGFPFQKALVDRTGATESFFRKCLLLAACAKDVHDRLKYLSGWLGRAPRVDLAHVLLRRGTLTNRYVHTILRVDRLQFKMGSLGAYPREIAMTFICPSAFTDLVSIWSVCVAS
jgi:hypothetical protein